MLYIRESKYCMEKEVSKNSIKYNLVKSLLIGFAAVFAAFYFVYSIAGNPYYEYLLITKGKISQGFITRAGEDVNDDDMGRANFSYYYSYTFESERGKHFNSYGESDGRLPDELSDLSKPYPVQVVYLENKPEVSKLKNTLCSSLSELLWRKFGLGIVLLLFLSSIGFVIMRSAIKNYAIERNKLNSKKE